MAQVIEGDQSVALPDVPVEPATDAPCGIDFACGGNDTWCIVDFVCAKTTA
jgi:hypothetical protein